MSHFRRVVFDAHLYACKSGVAAFTLGFDKDALLRGDVVVTCLAGQNDISLAQTAALFRAVAASLEAGMPADAPRPVVVVKQAPFDLDDLEDMRLRAALVRMNSALERSED